jgi:hypothetical protein
MSIAIQPYREEHESAVQAFNKRLRVGTSDPNLVFYGRCHPEWLPKMEGSQLYNQYFVALEDSVVRGAYALKYERFFLRGRGEYTVACYHHPLSEGIVNRAYSAVGSLLLRDALWREPMLYALGMGGYDRPLPKMLKVMGWNLRLVPFYFRIIHPYRFLRQMTILRQSLWKRCLMDLAGFSGMGWIALTTMQNAKCLRTHGLYSFETAEIDEFSEWADRSWLAAKDAYRLTSVRDRHTITRLYAASDKDLTKVCVSQQGKPIGWAVVGERRHDPKYGCLRVGSIVDCWAHPENAPRVMLAATRKLQEKGMDLIVSNQSHRQWGLALKQCGFFQAESNFIFATSKKHSALLQQGDLADFHLNRANGDGLPRNF